jgi:hypothetical protein
MAFRTKQRIRVAQIKAALKVNVKLLTLYLHIGKEIIEKQKASNWVMLLLINSRKIFYLNFPIWRDSHALIFLYTQMIFILQQRVRKSATTCGTIESGIRYFRICPQLVIQIPLAIKHFLEEYCILFFPIEKSKKKKKKNFLY